MELANQLTYNRYESKLKDGSKNFILSVFPPFLSRLLISNSFLMANSLAEFSALSSVSSSSDNENAQNVESARGKNPSPDDSTQKPTDEKSSLRKQLEEKQKELEAAQKMVQNLTKREKDLIDR